MSWVHMKRSPAHEPKPGNPAAAVDLAGVVRELAALPVAAPDPRAPRAPRTDTKRYLIERLRESLFDAMVNRHQSPEALAELLGRWGIAIRPTTLRRYLGPITERRRPAAPPTDKPATDKPATGEPSPARAGRETAPSARPRAGEVGSPEALARLEAVLAGESSGPPPVQAAAPAARPRSDDPPYCPPGTFVPRPDLPLEEWYKPSETTP
jgi:hypothetical protein